MGVARVLSEISLSPVEISRPGSKLLLGAKVLSMSKFSGCRNFRGKFCEKFLWKFLSGRKFLARRQKFRSHAEIVSTRARPWKFPFKPKVVSTGQKFLQGWKFRGPFGGSASSRVS